MKTLFVLFCLAFSTCSSQEFRCPPKEDIKPCSCSTTSTKFVNLDQKASITCNGLSSSSELLKAVNGMRGFKVSNFYLDKSNVGDLPSNLFQNVEIQSLAISFTKLSGLSESLNRPPFLGLEGSLETLKITDAFTNDSAPLMRLSLSHLKKLTNLQLGGNILPVIGNDWFESGPYYLRELDLVDTYTTKLGSHAFVSLDELRKLRLTGGHLFSITRDVLPQPALHLVSLDLSNNRLQVLPNNMFYKMPSLEKVYLENNALTTINEVAFAQTWSQLSMVYYYGNPINCDKDIKWIYKYRMPEELKGTCASPSNLMGRSLSNLTLSNFE